MTLTKDNTTIYVTRSIRNDDQYCVFLTCIEKLQKYLKDFPIIVIIDNESYTSKDIQLGDNLLKSSVTFIQSEFPSLAEWLPYYHFKNHPTEYMLYIHDDVLITKELDFNDIEQKINHYGLCHLCVMPRCSKYSSNNSFENYMNNIYNYCLSLFPFTQQLLDKHKMIYPSQGSQCFTSYTVINKINEKFGILNDMNRILQKNWPPLMRRIFIEHFYAELCYDVMNSEQLTTSIFIQPKVNFSYNFYMKNQSKINPNIFIHCSTERFN